MSKLLTDQEAKNVANSDDENLVPAGDYRAKIVLIDRSERKPEVLQWKFRIIGGQASARRELRAWTSTAPNGAWALKRLVKDIVADWSTVQLEDLEGQIVTAHVTIEPRSDTGELTNRVNRLSPWTGGTGDGYFSSDEDETA